MLTQKQSDYLDVLENNTHAFMLSKFVDKVAHEFNVELTSARYEANPTDPKGLTLDNGATSAVGLSVYDIATILAHKYGAEYMEAFGRGTTVRRAVEALRAKLNEDEQERIAIDKLNTQ